MSSFLASAASRIRLAAGTLLSFGSVPDGSFLKRNGSQLVGDNPAGSGDVTAAAAIDDEALVRGDGGAKGVRKSGILVGDDNVLTVPEQADDPGAAPASGKWKLFFKAGGLYAMDDAGSVVGPFGAGGGGSGGVSSITVHTGPATLTAPAGRNRHVGDTSGGDVDLELPPAGDADLAAELVFVKRGAANDFTVTPSGSETINGETGSLILTVDGEYAVLWPTAGGWILLSQTPLMV